jgi:hypothetical protein
LGLSGGGAGEELQGIEVLGGPVAGGAGGAELRVWRGRRGAGGGGRGDGGVGGRRWVGRGGVARYPYRVTGRVIGQPILQMVYMPTFVFSYLCLILLYPVLKESFSGCHTFQLLEILSSYTSLL